MDKSWTADKIPSERHTPVDRYFRAIRRWCSPQILYNSPGAPFFLPNQRHVCEASQERPHYVAPDCGAPVLPLFCRNKTFSGSKKRVDRPVVTRIWRGSARSYNLTQERRKGGLINSRLADKRLPRHLYRRIDCMGANGVALLDDLWACVLRGRDDACHDAALRPGSVRFLPAWFASAERFIDRR